NTRSSSRKPASRANNACAPQPMRRKHRRVVRTKTLARDVVVALERACRNRKRYAERVRFIDHRAEILADKIDIERDRRRFPALQRRGDHRPTELQHVRTTGGVGKNI